MKRSLLFAWLMIVSILLPTIVKADWGSESDPFWAGDVIAFYERNETKSDVWIEGYIIGYTTGQWSNFVNGIPTQSNQKTNIVLCNLWNPSSYKECISVQLPKGEVRNALNLYDNPGNFGKLVKIRGDIQPYCGGPGVKNTSEFKFDGSEPDDPEEYPNYLCLMGDLIYKDANNGYQETQSTFDRPVYSAIHSEYNANADGIYEFKNVRFNPNTPAARFLFHEEDWRNNTPCRFKGADSGNAQLHLGNNSDVIVCSDVPFVFNHENLAFNITVDLNTSSINIKKGDYILIRSHQSTINVGEKLQLEADYYENGVLNNKYPLEWYTDYTNEDILTCTEGGLVEGIGSGSATVFVTVQKSNYEYIRASCEIYVTRDKVQSITLSDESVVLRVGTNNWHDSEHVLTYTIQPEDAQAARVTWSSDDPNIATVDEYGVVHAVAPGKTYVWVHTEDGVSAKCEVSVITRPAVDYILLDHTDETLQVGETLKLMWHIEPVEAESAVITWRSDDPDVATVDNTGLIKAVHTGITYIWAITEDGPSAKCMITVDLNATSVELDHKEINLERGEQEFILATIKPEGFTSPIEWLTKDENIAGVRPMGICAYVYGIDKGETYVGVHVDGLETVWCKVKVTVPTRGIELSQTELILEKGDTYTLKASVEPSDATDKSVTWSSSNASVATVDNNGKVTAVALGTATITAKTGTFSAQCKVTVALGPEMVVLDVNSLTLPKGGEAKINAVVLPEEVANKTITWKSSNTGVATVNNGVVTGKSVGVANITATCGKVSATCKVKVINTTADFVEQNSDNVYIFYKDLKDGNCAVTYATKEYNSYSGIVNIPETVNHNGTTYKVIEIDENAFFNSTDLISVNIPKSVKEIKNGAFSGCSNLRTLATGNGVTKLSGGCFDGLLNLASLTVGTNVKELENSPFISAVNLCKLMLLGNVVPTGIETAFAQNGNRVTYVANSRYNDIKILGQLKELSFLSSIYTANGVKYVPLSMSDRTAIAIDCDYNPTLTKTSIPNEIKLGDFNFTVEYYGANLMYLNHAITDVKIGEYVRYEGFGAFGYCENLERINLPETHIDIHEGTFMGCKKLKKVQLPSTLVEISDYAFAYSGLTEIVVPANTQRICNAVFNGCKDLALVKAETADSGLKLGYNKLGKDSETESGVTVSATGEGLFKDCKLKNVILGRNIEYDSSSKAGFSPFSNNDYLEYIEFTHTPDNVPDNVCFGCTGLTNVFVGDNVQSIGENAFSGCSSLQMFTIGKNVKTIGEEAFSDCAAMTEFYSKPTVPPVCGNQALDDINKFSCKLYVPQGSVNMYKKAEQWKEFLYCEASNFENGISVVINDDDDTITIEAGMLINADNRYIEVYTVSGMCVYSGHGSSVALPTRGIYVVRIGSKTVKLQF